MPDRQPPPSPAGPSPDEVDTPLGDARPAVGQEPGAGGHQPAGPAVAGEASGEPPVAEEPVERAMPVEAPVAAATEPPPATAYPPAGRRGRGARALRRIVIAVLAAALVTLVAGSGWLLWQLTDTLRTDPSRATTGDCLRGTADPDDLRRVDCDHEAAAWRVVAVAPAVTWGTFQDTPDEQLCAEHPAAELAVWYGDRGASGDLFCLEPMR